MDAAMIKPADAAEVVGHRRRSAPLSTGSTPRPAEMLRHLLARMQLQSALQLHEQE